MKTWLSLSFTKYLHDVWSLVTRANRYVEENAPWTLAKNKDLGRLGSVLYNLSESLRLIALYLYPVMPSTSQKIWNALGLGKADRRVPFERRTAMGNINPRHRHSARRAIIPQDRPEQEYGEENGKDSRRGTSTGAAAVWQPDRSLSGSRIS